jgi:hypothetical protein
MPARGKRGADAFFSQSRDACSEQSPASSEQGKVTSCEKATHLPIAIDKLGGAQYKGMGAIQVEDEPVGVIRFRGVDIW